MERIDILKRHLLKNGFDAEELEDLSQTSYDDKTFEIYNQEWMILTDEEADKKATDSIKETLWAFNSDFIIEHSAVLDFDNASEKIIRAIQELDEYGNDAMERLIDDLDEFIQDAIEADGRPHFMNTYNGEEYEQEDDNGETYYIYQIN